MYCKNCGEKLDDGSVFCAKCGMRLDDGPVAKRDEAPAAASGQQHKVEFFEAIKLYFTRWTFDGRSSRSEYWWPVLLGALVSFIPGLDFIYCVASIAPSIFVAVRRLHDVGKSGWWYWFILLPFVGWGILIYLFCQRSDSQENKYGPVPNVG